MRKTHSMCIKRVHCIQWLWTEPFWGTEITGPQADLLKNVCTLTLKTFYVNKFKYILKTTLFFFARKTYRNMTNIISRQFCYRDIMVLIISLHTYVKLI